MDEVRKTSPERDHVVHSMRTMATFLNMAAGAVTRFDPPLGDDELERLANQVDGVVQAMSNLVSLDSAYPALLLGMDRNEP